MNDLNERIARWRASLEPRLGSKAADELEDHLRTVIESLSSTGLPEQERLLLAMHRLGQPETLASEFEKNCSARVWHERIAWMLVGLVPLHFVWSLLRQISAIFGNWLLVHGFSSLPTMIGYVVPQFTFVATIFVAAWLIRKQDLPDRWDLAKWLPTSFGGMAIFLGIAFAAVFIIHGSFSILLIPFLSSIENSRPERYSYRMQSYAYMRQWLELAYSVVFAVLTAWLITRRQNESGPATVSAEDS